MSDILFIKISLIGDVIYYISVRAEARRQRGGACFTWLDDEAFAPAGQPTHSRKQGDPSLQA
jgi:ADP-heptose:LPS heptosyltransferase